MNMLALWAILATGCESVNAGKYAPPTGDPTPWEEDSGTESLEAFCDGQPMVNWDNFGRGFFRESCQGCHSSVAVDRYGAPEYINYDGPEDIWANTEWVLRVAGGDEPTMPPQGGTTVEDRQRLEVWLLCADEGT